MRMRKWISSVAVATVVSLAVVASAAAGDVPPRKAVKTWGLNLAEPGDVATLYGRIRAAATAVCRAEIRRHYHSTRTPPPMGWRERCIQDAVDGAVRAAASVKLAALHTQTPRIAAR